MELVGNVDWPEENTLPADAQLTLTTPFEIQLVALGWKSADPRSAAKLTASVTMRDSSPYNLDAYYELDLPNKMDVHLKMQDSWAFQLNSEIKPEGFLGLFSITTPIEKLKAAELSILMDSNEPKYEGSFRIDSSALSGSVRAHFTGNDDGGNAKADVQVELSEMSKVILKGSIDPEKTNIKLEISAFEWSVKSGFQRDQWSKYAWNTEINAESDGRKWLLDADLDFRNVSSIYQHNITYQAVHHQVIYSTYGLLFTDDTQYRGKMGAAWDPSKNPLEIKFTNTKVERKLGNAVIEIITPWTDEPSVTVNVDLDARKKVVETRIGIETAEKILSAIIDIKYVNLNSIKANSTGKNLRY